MNNFLGNRCHFGLCYVPSGWFVPVFISGKAVQAFDHSDFCHENKHESKKVNDFIIINYIVKLFKKLINISQMIL